MHHEGATLTTPIQKAEAFCRFFVSKFVKEDNISLRKIKEDLSRTASGTNVSDLVISEDDVYKLPVLHEQDRYIEG